MPAGFPQIADVGLDTPARLAAGAILNVRLRNVEKLLRRCREEEPTSSEGIHLLRASTRKAAAAFDAFSELLPARRVTRLRSRLRRIRRAAGSIRDCDVALEILRDLVPQSPGLEGLTETIAALEAHRTAELEALRPLVRKRVERKLRRSRRRLRARLHHSVEDEPTSPRTFGELAPGAIAAAVERVRGATAADLTSLDSLHTLRIGLRKLRFSLDIFESCVASAPELMPPLRELVALLGRVNDLARVAAVCEQVASHGRVAAPDVAARDQDPRPDLPVHRSRLGSRFALIRDRRHAHALTALAALEGSILNPLVNREAGVSAAPPPVADLDGASDQGIIGVATA